MNKGILYGIGAYTIWGLLPIYWKTIKHVPPGEILANRMVWSLVFVLVLLAVKQRWDWVRPALHSRRILLTFTTTAVILSINWFTYIWAVNSGFIVETSLGYFINPLVNVLLGVLFLKESLRRGQLAAIGLAVVGVSYLTLSYGAFPWIALTLAFTFGFYGLLRKTAPLPSTEGLALETAVLFVPALSYLIWLALQGRSAFDAGDPLTDVLLVLTGIATGLPLLLFGAAARRITLTNLGLLQYLAPTLQFMIGVYIYHEPFTRNRLIGFGIIWLALLIYTAESLLRSRRRTTAVAGSGVP